MRPVWSAVRPAGEALGLTDLTLLHAGPPLADPRHLSPPLLSSAVMCCLYEGWAGDEAEAEWLITSGQVVLRPAQEYDVVIPLAAVVSSQTTLVEIVDLNDDASTSTRRAYSLLASGSGPQLRFGNRDPRIIQQMVWRDGPLADCLSALLAVAPVPLLPLVTLGLAGGDDMHARTTAANTALCTQLLPMIKTKTWLGPKQEQERIAAMLADSPQFFLTIWMAACHLMLLSAADGGRDHDSTIVITLAGNGESLGIRLAGKPGEWFTVPAHAPDGPRISPTLQAKALPIIGDSGVIDVAGFGGQALEGASEIVTALGTWLPNDWRERPSVIRAGHHHPIFSRLGLGAGVDAAAVAANSKAPLILIAMIDAAGEKGLLGHGLFIPPVDLFMCAVASVHHEKKCETVPP